MKLKHYPPTPNLGDTKTIIKFAWWPTRVGDSLIWLERYEEVWVYKEVTIRLIRGVPITRYMWKLQSTKLTVNKPGLPDFKNPPPPPPPEHPLKFIRDHLKQDFHIKEFAQKFRTLEK